jgi:hypothetical protein
VYMYMYPPNPNLYPYPFNINSTSIPKNWQLINSPSPKMVKFIRMSYQRIPIFIHNSHTSNPFYPPILWFGQFRLSRSPSAVTVCLYGLSTVHLHSLLFNDQKIMKKREEEFFRKQLFHLSRSHTLN